MGKKQTVSVVLDAEMAETLNAEAEERDRMPQTARPVIHNWSVLWGAHLPLVFFDAVLSQHTAVLNTLLTFVGPHWPNNPPHCAVAQAGPSM